MKIEVIEIGNFRKLQNVRVGISDEETVFVGANNSGKTSAMVALRHFLVERERSKFSLNDFTLSHWPTIDEMGRAWEEAKTADKELPTPAWSPLLPFLDVWLTVAKSEAHFVQKLIPTLDWDGGRMGVRLRLEPKDAEQLQKDFLTAREEAKLIEAADTNAEEEIAEIVSNLIVLWPRSLTEFLQRRFKNHFTVEAYILDPDKLIEPKYGLAEPQELGDDAISIEGEPFKGLIRIDEIPAQRGFGQIDGTGEADEDGPATRASTTRKMSEQLRRYWNKHLDPFENPDAKDIGALRAIEQAQKAFDDRLREGFADALNEVEGLGYPGITDPHLKISTRLKPIDGLNHDTAVQYMIQMIDGKNTVDLNLPEDSNGLGYQNLISMVFRLMSARDAWMKVGKAASKTAADSETLIPPLHLVLIEEPEAYLHTQVQQVFIRQAYKILRNHDELQKDASNLTTQMIVSTHSSHIAHECDFDSLRYFRRLPASEKGVPISGVVNLGSVFGDNLETKRFVTRYIKVTHCDLFFADAAVLVEGAAERILVPFFIQNQPNLRELNECYVTWLEIGGSHAHRLRSLIEHLGLTTLIITDLDAKDDANKSVAPTRGANQKSRNVTLGKWWPVKDDLDELLDLKSEKKIKEYKNQHFSIRVAYQCPVQITFKGAGSEVLANTLEDALVMQNIALFSKDGGKGLFSKFKTAIDDSKTIDNLSETLFQKIKSAGSGAKAEFALDLLEIEKPAELQPPLYILEGLTWLAAQLRQKQQDLGMAASKTNDKEKAS